MLRYAKLLYLILPPKQIWKENNKNWIMKVFYVMLNHTVLYFVVPALCCTTRSSVPPDYMLTTPCLPTALFMSWYETLRCHITLWVRCINPALASTLDVYATIGDYAVRIQDIDTLLENFVCQKPFITFKSALYTTAIILYNFMCSEAPARSRSLVV